MIKKQCSTKWLADFCGISDRQIQRLAADGSIPAKDPKTGLFDTEACIKAYMHNLQNALKRGGTDNAEVAKSKARLEKARAEKEELEVAKMLAEVVLAEDVQEMWENASSNWKAKILGLPSKIATQTATLHDRHDIEDVVTTMIESTLNELALYGNTRQDTKPAKAKANTNRRTGKAKATAKAKRKPVGG